MENKDNYILLYCPCFTPQQSGYVHAFVLLAQNIANHHFKVHILTPEPLPEGCDEFTYPNITVFRYAPKLNIWLLGLVYSNYRMAQYLQTLDEQFRYQIILLETGDEPFLISFLPNYLLCKTVVRFHATSDTEYLIISTTKRYVIKKLAWKYLISFNIKHVVATSNYHRLFVKQYLGLANTYTNQLLINAYKSDGDKNEKVSNTVHFVTLGRMDEEGYKQKGFEYLLQALLLCKDEFLKVQANYTIIGKGKYFSVINDFVLTHQLSFVTLIPEMTNVEVSELLKQTDIVVLPSIYEGLSMFALEAIAHSNAVIFSNTGGLVDMVHHNGELVEPKNTEELAHALLKMLHTKFLHQMKVASKQLCIERFSEDVQWKQFETIMQSIKQFD